MNINLIVILVLTASCNAQFDIEFESDFEEQNVAGLSSKEYEENNAKQLVQNLRWAQHENMADLYLSNATDECQQDFGTYMTELMSLKPWALKMADSTGKFESGFIDGNTMFEGRYLQCINANDDNSNSEFDPLYCRARWFGPLPTSTPWYYKGLGICIPDSCTNDDARILMNEVFMRPIPERASIHCERGNDLSSDPEAIISIIILGLIGLLVFTASVYDKATMCKFQSIQTDEKSSKKDEKQTTTYDNPSFKTETDKNSNANNNTESGNPEAKEIDGPVLKLKEPSIAYAIETDSSSKSSYEVVDVEKAKATRKPNVAEQLLLCFSLYKNVPLVVSAKSPPGSYRCLNGMRVIAMFCVVFGHTYSDSWLNAFENTKSFIDSALDISFSRVLAMDLYVDTFFILSAFLVTISFMKQLKRRDGKLSLVDLGLHYFNRYWRLTPTYLLVLMVYTNLTHYFISGPFANDFESDIDDCSTEWWKNLLYVNTLFLTPGKSCMGWSWYLAVDMQLFIIAPLFLYILYRWEKIGLVGLVLGFTGGMISNIVLWEKYYTQTDTTEDPVVAFQDIYIKPWTRCPVYFMGMLLGYLFYKTNGKLKMPKVVVLCGWIIGLSIFFMVAYLPPLLDCLHLTELDNCDWSIAGQVTWSTLYRPMWGIWVCWLILACSSGYGGILNTFLSWNFFVPLGKLSYLCYLIHYIIVVIYYNGAPTQFYFTHLNMFYIFCGNLVITFVLALIASVTISAPLMKLAAVFIPSRRGKTVR